MHAGTECDIGRLATSLLFVKLGEDSISRLVLTTWMYSNMRANIQNLPDICRAPFAYFVVSNHHCPGLLYCRIQAREGHELLRLLKP